MRERSDMRELKGIEEKILDRTLFLIGKNGSSNVSIRAIAKEANVNVSAINYYFRTKDEMLRHAKEFYMSNTRMITSILDQEELEEEEKLILFANEIMEYVIRFPGITVLLKEAVEHIEDEISQQIVAVTHQMHQKMEYTMRKVINKDQQRFEYSRMIFMSSLIYPIENFDITRYDEGLISNRDNRIKYITHLIKVLREA
jgi:AcrR family transcriptional regulator